MAVIATFELHELVATSDTSCQANRGHGRFSAAVHHAHHLDRRDGIDDFLCELHFELGRCSEARASGCDFLHRSDDFFVCMAQDHRSPRADVIDVSVAVDVSDGGAAVQTG